MHHAIPPLLLLATACSGRCEGQGLQPLTMGDLQAFVSRAHEAMVTRFDVLEPNLTRKGVSQRRGSPAWFMGATHAGRPASRNITHFALMAEETTKYMAHTLGVSGVNLTGVEVRGTPLSDLCPRHHGLAGWCRPRRYRSLSAHCNNVQNPWWGAAGIPYLRFLPPQYADSIATPRGTGRLPERIASAREVSLVVHRQLDRQHSHLVALAPIWGQFVSHDLSLTPQMTGYQGERLKCCNVEYEDFHPECFPIRLPRTDPVHGGSPCQEYTRSASAPRTDCTLGPREQLNEASSFLDGSAVYGSSEEVSESLRTWQGGQLATQPGALLPANKETKDCFPHPKLRCFLSGDVRVNEHIGLAGLHTIWVREHNRLAAALAQLNTHWPDEILFQEARRIVIAQLQHITYSEFLPLIIGQDMMDSLGVRPEREGHYTGYSTDVNPTLANSVASTALHFAISLMPTHITLYTKGGKEDGVMNVSEGFFAPFKLYEREGVETVVSGLLRTPANSNGQHINSVFTDHMYEKPGQEGRGLDLVAQIIQRGRDHGIPAYVEWRKFCGLPASSYQDLEWDIPTEALENIKQVYKDVQEIDLLSGSLSEGVPAGATVGPTLRCLLGHQFAALRKGDRHWYENDLPGGLTAAQLRTIRTTSAAGLLCRNTRLEAVQPAAFLTPDPFLNSEMECGGSLYADLDLSPWREDKPLVLIPRSILTSSLDKAKRDLTDLHKHEYNLYLNNKLADPLSPVGTAFGFSRPKRQALQIANTSLMLEYASVRIVRSFLQGELQDVEGSVGGLISRLPTVEVDMELGAAESSCLESALPCDHTAPYRTYSGWCNNLDKPEQGRSFRPFNRMLSPHYHDGVGEARSVSVQGGVLPSPRLISITVHSDAVRPHTRYSLMVMQFAQITDHDLTFTPVNKGFVGEGILNCAACDSSQTVHPQCFPIPVPEGDPYFPSKDSTGKPLCIPATRSLPGQLSLGQREQMNQLTAYLDLSFMYGSDECEASVLRLHSGGRMNVTVSRQAKPLLPQTPSNPECRSPSHICFNAGDARASEQPALGSLHTVWLREHNRVAAELARLNPLWGDERLYQETRKLLGAVYQHIAFREFLPRVLGWDAIHKYKLNLLTEGYYSGYDENCDVTIMNEFSAAAFRFGHSLLRPHFRRVNPDFQPKEPPIRLRDHFFNPQVLYTPHIIDDLILGLTDTPMETLDNFITKEVTQHLFENKSIPYSGMDLISLNIQRGRDHGLGGYTRYRAACGLPTPADFASLADTTPPELIAHLSSVYSNVDDIDLFPGAMSERPLHGALLGPTFACIVARQFSAIRNCDRFWYENDQEFTRFTKKQLIEIRKASLARLVCDNLDHVKTIQRNIFDLPDPFMNPRVKCSQVEKVDLSPWRERKGVCAQGDGRPLELGKTSNRSPCVTCTCTKEGSLCQSVRVRNCLALLVRFSAEEVAADTVCKVQCLYVFKAAQDFSVSNKTYLFT